MDRVSYETILQADRLLIYGLLDQAEELYGSVLEREPGNSEAAFGLARVAVERDDLPLAHQRVAHAVALNPRNDDAQRLLARMAEIIAERDAPTAAPRPTSQPSASEQRDAGPKPVDGRSSCKRAQAVGGKRAVRVLVTGGAGYVGSTSAERLVEAGHDVVVLDSMLRGYEAAVPSQATLVVGDVGDRDLVERTLREQAIEAVLHCAGLALVGESVAQPDIYYRDNVVGGVAMLEAMRAAGVRRIVFSSSAAVYGAPTTSRIEEDHALRPVNPYGETKRAFEGSLDWFTGAYGMAAFSLRYFNVAGATAERGEDHRPETHLIPNLFSAVQGGPPIEIFGTDYPTSDGTCIRDYIHVDDLAAAHIAALELTATAENAHVPCNLGSGSGFSVLEVLKAAEAVVGQPIPHSFGPRRAGDPPVLVASNERAGEVLGWQPRHGSLDEIIGSAWAWRTAHPHGYGPR